MKLNSLPKKKKLNLQFQDILETWPQTQDEKVNSVASAMSFPGKGEVERGGERGEEREGRGT